MANGCWSTKLLKRARQWPCSDFTTGTAVSGKPSPFTISRHKLSHSPALAGELGNVVGLTPWAGPELNAMVHL
jgi:hypothetical protein